MASAHLARARWRVLRGASPEADLEAAERALDRAPAAISALPPALAARAFLDTLRGVWAALHDRSPEEAFARAESNLGRAIELNGANATIHASVAEVALWRAWWRGRRGQSSKDDVEKGMAALSRALELNPRLARAEVLRAGLHEVEASTATNPGAATAARRLRDEGRARALALNPLLERESDAVLALLGR